MGDELRTQLAEALGLPIKPHKFELVGSLMRCICGCQEGAIASNYQCPAARHPEPALDSDLALGWVAKNMPEGWFIKLSQCTDLDGKVWWMTDAYFNFGEKDVHAEAHTEVEARAKLLLAILKANAGGRC